MKFTTVITAATLAFAGSTAAANHCTQGLKYCSTTLLYVDDAFYRPKLDAYEKFNIFRDYLWNCNANGQISLAEKCRYGCANGGVGKNDFCPPFQPRFGGE
ncbi:hypothetical protein AJ79_04634 [Helicocarpus griseus UAMH5409]|uniref:Uncharacterized protein n=1 Tax=Helicocarpus griseus UAMH5409 TaxID=1447875 RepID=A0A2B7XTM7_9EURO|nr:hypothetical protein AJ79_04634 [Helicocarpus griseus UAMH5409]